jgi:hypothetical protein
MNVIEKLLKNKQFSAVFMILAVVVAVAVVPNLSQGTLSVLDNTTVRVLLMVLIVGLSLVDPVKALLLAIVLVVSLMRLMVSKKTGSVTMVKSNNSVSEENNVSDEVSDEGHPEHAFDETEESGLNDTDLLTPENSELLNDTVSFNDNNSGLNSVNEPVVLGDVPTNDKRTSVDFNAVPYNNGVQRADASLADVVDRPNKIVIGSLLNEGFENPLVKNTLNNNTVDDALNSEETDPNNDLNNVLTANVPVVENTLEPVSTEKIQGVFTNEWQLKDIGTNLVGCAEKPEKVSMAKNTLGTQGNSSPSGYSF